jgi:hypothetical protein
MNTVQDGSLHDELRAVYQSLDVARLNEALKKHGIQDPALRQKICGDYLFDAGYFLDSGWLAHNDRRFKPGVYFAGLDAQGRATGEVVMPDPKMGTSFHEFAGGTADWLFEVVNEDVSDINTGDVNAA